MNVTNEWGANYYVLVGTKQLNSINAFTTAPYSNGGNVVFWIALNSQKQWGYLAGNNAKWTYPLSISLLLYVGVSGDVNGPDESVNYSKISAITYADLTHLWFATDNAAGDSYFIVIGA